MRYVTNEQRSRRTLFKPTLRAVASWLIFGVANSLRMDFRYARRSHLENQPTDPAVAGRYASYL
jgi:hypothetical protein